MQHTLSSFAESLHFYLHRLQYSRPQITLPSLSFFVANSLFNLFFIFTLYFYLTTEERKVMCLDVMCVFFYVSAPQ
jgi:hypothetical protein